MLFEGVVKEIRIYPHQSELMSIQKRAISFKIKDSEKNNHRHIVDIPRIIFKHDAEFGRKGRFWMGTNYQFLLSGSRLWFRYWTIVTAARAAVSARRIRGPKDTVLKPRSRARETSAG